MPILLSDGNKCFLSQGQIVQNRINVVENLIKDEQPLVRDSKLLQKIREKISKSQLRGIIIR